MLENRSKTQILMVSIAAAAMLFAGCSKKVEVSSDAGAKSSASHSSTATTSPSTHGINNGASVAAKPSISSVHFAFDSANLDGAARATLDGYAAWLNANNSSKITIEGNCDQRGSREYNLALGQQRADSIRDYLTTGGVSSGRIDTVSFGEERPACSGSGEACWAQNRRGDIVTR